MTAPGFPQLDGVTHGFVTVGGVRFHYAEAGTGEPLVLLHGWPQHWWTWRRQIPELARHYRVICPDLRGFGWSDAPPSGYGKEQLARDVVGVLDALGVDRFHLMAHDWGAWTGFLVCLFNPGRVRRYVSLGIPHPFQKADGRLLSLWRSWYMTVIAMPLVGALAVRWGLAGWLLDRGLRNRRWSAQERRIFLSRLKDPARVRASVKLYRAFVGREFLQTLLGRYRDRRLATPTLILFPTNDPYMSPVWRHGDDHYADRLTVETVEACGHFITEDQPELVVRRSLQFFAGDDHAA